MIMMRRKMPIVHLELFILYSKMSMFINVQCLTDIRMKGNANCNFLSGKLCPCRPARDISRYHTGMHMWGLF